MDSLEANIMEKSMRSVFVGNIPYDVSEETLKEIFCEVGQVVSFKLVYDRDDGKPKGYGFCEFRDQETALSAIRNLNGYEIGGRSLRVDNACTEKSRMEIMNLINQPSQSSPYGEPVSFEKAPEAVTKAVSTLPPEQMIELMSQMKELIRNNPTEAKKMLTKNPQLAYALLQIQVMMDVIDSTSASRMLHPTNKELASLMPVDKPLNIPISSAYAKPKDIIPVPTPIVEQPMVQPILYSTDEPVFTGQDVDLRFPKSLDKPPILPTQPPQRPQEQPKPIPTRGPPPRPGTSAHQKPQLPISVPHHSKPESSKTVDPRAQKRSDPRQKPSTSYTVPPPPTIQPPPQQTQPNFNPTTEQEKAALIMQVLQLSEEQIAMLPPEQRQSILQLKAQLALSKQL